MIEWGKTQINLKKAFINLKSIDIRLFYCCCGFTIEIIDRNSFIESFNRIVHVRNSL